MGNVLGYATVPQPIHFNLPLWLFGTMWLGILALFVLMVYAKSREIRKRKEAFDRLGMEMGFSYSDHAPDALATELAEIHFNSAQLEYRPRYSNVLEGSAGGGDAVIADRTVGSGKSVSTTTVIAFKQPAVLPTFVVSEENVFWKLVEKLGYSDIDIDGAPDFSRRYFLHGQDEAAVRALFKPEITQAFEQLDPKIHFHGNGSGHWLTFCRPGKRIPPEMVREILQHAEPIASAFRRARSSGIFS